jgi:hypothetical protein
MEHIISLMMYATMWRSGYYFDNIEIGLGISDLCFVDYWKGGASKHDC